MYELTVSLGLLATAWATLDGASAAFLDGTSGVLIIL